MAATRGYRPATLGDLADQGGGDVLDRDSYGTLGAWHGDCISLIGDYDESGLYEESQTYRDISWMVAEDFNDATELQGLGKYRLAWEKSP